MPDWLFMLLMKFLVEFLTELFKQLFGAKDPSPFKQVFLDRMKYRIWYGPKRMAVASAIYDQVVTRFNTGGYTVPAGTWVPADAKLVAEQLCAGIVKPG